MSTYDRSIRQTLRTALRRICGQRDPEPPERTAVILAASSRRRNRPGTCNGKRAAVYALLLAALLLAPALPAAAQDNADSIYLPAIVAGRTWFTDAELSAAQVANGFDPIEASMHTVCTLDASSQPPATVLYRSCNQYFVAGQPTEETGTPLWFYWKSFYSPTVSSALIGSASGAYADDASEAPCYIDPSDGMEVCG